MESATATARPSFSAAPTRAWSWVRRNGFKIYAGFAVAYMLIPIAVIAVFSFADASQNRDHLAFAINNGFTLKYWENAFSIPDLNTALLTSFRLAALATLISTAIGTLMAPALVMGASLLSLFLIYGIALGFTTLLIAHIMFCISFVVVVVRSRLIGFDRSIEDAAADLGATAIETFRYVTFPLLRPGILGAALLAFALSVDDFIVSDFNKGTTETFPIYVFGAHLRGIPVQVNVLARMLFALTVTAICFVLWQQKRADRLAAVRPEQEV